MEDDQQVAVLMQLNINERKENGNWENDHLSYPHDILIAETSGSEYQEPSFCENSDNSVINKDLDFIKKHATDADPDLLNCLLHSQINNPKRLETIMCDILNVPNGLNLVQKYQGNPVKIGEKRSNNESNANEEDIKKVKKNGSDSYLQQVRDMFPDADGLFLISECQQIKNCEDFSRFINTVMLSGVYPKKGSVEYSPKHEPTKVIDVVNNTEYRGAVVYSSEEEMSPSDISELSKQKKIRRRKAVGKSLDMNSDGVFPEVEVIDIASDNTEIYDVPDPESLQIIYDDDKHNLNIPMEVEEEEEIAGEDNVQESPNNLARRKLGSSNENERSRSPQPGPSRVSSTNQSRLSLPPAKLNFSPEKSLAEIIERHRHNRSRSLGSSFNNDLQRPSTSKAEPETIQYLEPLGETIEIDGSEEPVLDLTKIQNETEVESYSEVEVDMSNKKELLSSEVEWIDEQVANLIRIFPNTDPSYLKEQVQGMKGSTEEVNLFVVSKLERNDMPSRADYEKKLEIEKLQNRYTNNFSIEDFLKAVPDPWKYFTKGNRNCAKYKSHSLCYLKSAFRNRYVRDIVDVFQKNNHNLYLSYIELKKNNYKKRSSLRSDFECNTHRPVTIDIQFLQEVAFIENEKKIKLFVEEEKRAKQVKFDEAKRTGSLLECQCCFDSEVMVEDTFYCPKDHSFCRECIIKSVEVEMGNGKFQFECLTNCTEKFTISCLQNVLKPEVFSKIIQATQLEEVKAAGIEDLVQCPFCNYATIMPPEVKVMTCLNPECLKESCRLCKELNHIPLRCDEVEKSEEVKMRTYIENKMTEALVRTCYKCNKKFVKEEGCNKMTCTCGAKMCYVCRQPVTDYSHFNGQGGTEYHKCPLYSTNDELHVDLVMKIGEEAKAEALNKNPQTRLLHDPTIIKPEKSYETPMPGVRNGAALNVGLRAARGVVNREVRQRATQERRMRQLFYHQNQLPFYEHQTLDNFMLYFTNTNRRHRSHRERAGAASEESSSEDERGEPHRYHNRQRHCHRHPHNYRYTRH